MLRLFIYGPVQVSAYGLWVRPALSARPTSPPSMNAPRRGFGRLTAANPWCSAANASPFARWISLVKRSFRHAFSVGQRLKNRCHLHPLFYLPARFKSAVHLPLLRDALGASCFTA